MPPLPSGGPEDYALLVGLKAITVLLGLLVVGLAFRAWRRRRARSLLWLAMAMVVLTASSVSEGFAYQGLDWTLAQSHLFTAIVTLAGFALLVYSLYV